MNKKIIVIGVSLPILIFIFLEIVYFNKIIIDPPKLVEEYTKFLGSLVSVGLGFLLLNVYIDQKINKIDKNKAKDLFLVYFQRALSCCTEISNLLDISFTPEQLSDHQQRENQIFHLLSKLKILLEFLETNTQLINSQSYFFTKEDDLNEFTECLTSIHQLIVISDFRVEITQFKSLLTVVISSINNCKKIINLVG